MAELLERQLLECEVLGAMYSPEELCLDDEVLCQLHSALQHRVDDESMLCLPELSVTLRLRIGDSGATVATVIVRLPHLYPQSAARVDLSFPRVGDEARMRLLEELREVAREAASVDQECLAELAQIVVERGADLLDQQQGQVGGHTPSLEDLPPNSRASSSFFGRRVLWFHHIKSVQKRKSIVALANAVGLHGACKPGFPGVLLAEGVDDDLDQFVHELKALRWQAMEVRYEARGIKPTEDQCSLPRPFIELPENGMGELSAICDTAAAAWREIFRVAVLKLKPSVKAKDRGVVKISSSGKSGNAGASSYDPVVSLVTSCPPWCVAARDGGSRLSVRVRPGARCTCLTVEHCDLDVATQLTADLHAAPRDGEANAELVSLFARLLRLSKSNVYVQAHSAKSRDKELTVEGLDPSEVVARIRTEIV